MMSFFTAQEKTVIITLSSLLGIRYMIQSVKDYYYEGTNHFSYLGTNEEVADYYAKLNHNEFSFQS